ncbi:helix-turn-helix domain-containing protein [Candidatus Woesearchaeota archaeon]|jgi:DNA-binding transcriptional ArsR family regulator|nr:helix-turn-helix domain-containing protein [Candidatus Woesearchaeota archaeon]MBT7929349.1 helix-turn-helix domain-containing protein [Candidatus Peregrinibacteria bacterium]MBT3537188.1 helix-turn-helix domain-containing protein [Candidatus Woesearchaeota archaeon]MBT4696666.1 helix-turn-helix domain-containing protein [Candidatus Woesearchaeota archaeon]MBT4716480.1 helix-turn-helix domain-containing protein [Candidatus Woesearchaeota archaeon]
MPKSAVVKEIDGKLFHSDVLLLHNPKDLAVINDNTRIKILRLLNKEPMYPAEIAKKLKLHEQRIYYHIKLLLNAGIIEVTERKEIRGTVAKKLAPKNLNFAVCLDDKWKPAKSLFSEEADTKLNSFLHPFIEDNKLNATTIVGSPDPHGPHKARARDGHYAIDLALFLGAFCNTPKEFSTKLDVDVKSDKAEKNNMIIVGGPVTNILTEEMNKHLPIKFNEKKNWAIESVRTKKVYTDDNCGIIAKIRNPNDKDKSILLIAGIRFSGTKSAVIGLTRFHKQILEKYKKDEEFACIVQGFDLDGDGKIDSIEVLES